jgi:hypothetical protein
LIVAGTLCAALALYVVGYFFGCERHVSPIDGKRQLVFSRKSMCALYSRAAWLEWKITQKRVALNHRENAPPGEGIHYGVYPDR